MASCPKGDETPLAPTSCVSSSAPSAPPPPPPERPSMLAVLHGGAADRLRRRRQQQQQTGCTDGGGGGSRIDRAVLCLGWRQRYIHADQYPLEVRGVTMPLRQLKQGELRGLGTGATVWAAAHVLCKYLERRFGGVPGEDVEEDAAGRARRLSQCMAGLRVIDLGAGTGAAGLAAALLGATVTLTDQQQLAFLIHENGARVAAAAEAAAAAEGWAEELQPLRFSVATYDWGGEDGHLGALPFDVVLVSDCVLPKLYPIEPLVDALDKLTTERTSAEGGASSGSSSESSSSSSSSSKSSSPVILMSYEHRTWKDFDPRERFAELAGGAGLTKRLVRDHDEQFAAEDIELWEVVRTGQPASDGWEGSRGGNVRLVDGGGAVDVAVRAGWSERRVVYRLAMRGISVAEDLWASSLVMAEHLSRVHPLLAKGHLASGAGTVRVLELGSGLGLVALVASRQLGCEVIASDKESALPLLRQNLAPPPPSSSSTTPLSGGADTEANSNGGSSSGSSSGGGGSVQVVAFDWALPPPPAIAERAPFDGPRDVVVCADCLYDSSSVAPLLAALRAVSPGRVLVANELRTPLDAFLGQAGGEFSVAHLGICEEGGLSTMHRRPVGLYELTRKATTTAATTTTTTTMQPPSTY